MITDFDRNLLDSQMSASGCYNKSHYKGGTFGIVWHRPAEIFGRSGSDGIPTTPWMSAPFWLKKPQLIPGVWYTGTMIYRINMYKWYTYTYGLPTDYGYPWFRTRILLHGAQFFGQNPCNTHRHRHRWFTTFYNILQQRSQDGPRFVCKILT